jgi:hypothetical protein
MAKIRSGLTFGQLVLAVPRQYRERLPPFGKSASRFTLVQFASDREDIILSSEVSHTLGALPPSAEMLIAIGGNFTAEAQRVIEDRSGIFVRLSDFHWSDESYKTLYSRDA